MSFGVYIHFPYCAKRCPYCDFATHARERIPHDEYERAVRRELAARAPLFAGRQLASIYGGGGTPGLWRPDCVARVLADVRERLAGEAPLEVTLEANPGSVTAESLDGFRAAGVNRLSFGVQSLAPRHLQQLGRDHRPEDAARAVAAARAAGVDNLSLDLMFGLPGQTLAELHADLDGLLALAPDHLSIYNLTVEERTPFGALQREGRLKLPDHGLQAEMYQAVGERARAAGYDHYEISNYARAGRRAVHNTIYWSGGEWLGLGSSSHSFRRVGAGGERFATVRSVDDYLARIDRVGEGQLPSDPIVASHEALDGETLGREAIWLGLRLLADGVDRARYAARFGADPLARFPGEFERLSREALVEVDAARARLTARGALFADEVGARFI